MRLRIVLSATALVVLFAPASAHADFAHTVLPGESLSSIAAADGLSVAQLAADNGLTPDAQLTVGSTVMIPPLDASSAASGTSTAATGDGDADSDDAAAAQTATGDGDADSDDGPAATSGPSTQGVGDGDADPDDPPAPSQAPAVGTTITGSMSWFGGPDDPFAGGPPASGLGYLSDGMAFYNYGSLGGHWLVHFPWGQTLSMTQIDLGPAPSTGETFDIAYTALPSTPYTEQTWPNPTVTATYEGP